MNQASWSQRLKAVTAPALLVVLPLCLFGPYTIFSGNEAEFSAPFGEIIPPLLVVGASIALALIILGLALRGTPFRVYVALLFGLGIVIWIQGNFLVADYGPLDGTAIDFALQSWRNPYEIALWTIVPLLCVAGARWVARIAPFASAMLVAVQVAALTVSAFNDGGRARAEWKGPDASMFELSRRQLSIVAGKSKALLIVKAPGSSGPVRVSNAPTTISDVAATVLDAAGAPRSLPGEPALKLAEHAQRVRGFGMYDWEDDGWKQAYFDALDLLELRGPAIDGNNWTLVDSLYPPDAGDINRTRGVHEVQRSRSGFEYRWSSPHGYFHAPPQARQFQIEIRSIAPKPQTVTMAAAGRVLNTITLSDQAWVTVKGALPPPPTPATNWLELHIDPPWRPRGEARLLGVQTRGLKFGP